MSFKKEFPQWICVKTNKERLDGCLFFPDQHVEIAGQMEGGDGEERRLCK